MCLSVFVFSSFFFGGSMLPLRRLGACEPAAKHATRHITTTKRETVVLVHNRIFVWIFVLSTTLQTHSHIDAQRVDDSLWDACEETGGKWQYMDDGETRREHTGTQLLVDIITLYDDARYLHIANAVVIIVAAATVVIVATVACGRRRTQNRCTRVKCDIAESRNSRYCRPA